MMISQHSLTPETLALMTLRVEPYDSTDQLRAVQDARTPAAALEHLAEMVTPDGLLAGCVARNPNTPPRLLRAMANNLKWFAKEGGISNPSLPADLILALSTHPDHSIRCSVAHNPSAPADMVARFAFDQDLGIAVAAAANRKLPEAALPVLAKHRNWDVRNAVARNLATPPGVLAALTHDRHDYVRRAAAGNPKTPPAALQAVVKSIPRRTRSRGRRIERDLALSNPSLPIEFLIALAPSAPDAACALAGRPDVSVDILVQIATDPKAPHSGVACHEKTPLEILEYLASDPSPWVRSRVVPHSKVTPELREFLCNDPHPEVRASIVSDASERKDWAMVERFAWDRSQVVRSSVACYLVKLSPSARAHLEADPCRGVRYEVRRAYLCAGIQ
jgi:hypothetical protein